MTFVTSLFLVMSQEQLCERSEYPRAQKMVKCKNFGVKSLFFFPKHLKILLINTHFIFLYKEYNTQKDRGSWWE